MLKITLLLISLIMSYAFNSNKIEAQIISTSQNKANINKNIKYGLSGFVIHNNMMIAKAISIGDSKVKYLPLLKLQNKALATPLINPKKGDKIIFGLYNFRWLLIAPNQNDYLKVIKNNPNVTFINSDIFANYFITKPTKQDFQGFCRDFNVGIIDFILDKEYIVDCESFVVLNTKPTDKIKYTNAFYNNYTKLTSSLFSSIPNNWINYYKSMLKVSK